MNDDELIIKDPLQGQLPTKVPELKVTPQYSIDPKKLNASIEEVREKAKAREKALNDFMAKHAPLLGRALKRYKMDPAEYMAIYNSISPKEWDLIHRRRDEVHRNVLRSSITDDFLNVYRMSMPITESVGPAETFKNDIIKEQVMRGRENAYNKASFKEAALIVKNLLSAPYVGADITKKNLGIESSLNPLNIPIDIAVAPLNAFGSQFGYLADGVIAASDLHDWASNAYNYGLDHQYTMNSLGQLGQSGFDLAMNLPWTKNKISQVNNYVTKKADNLTYRFMRNHKDAFAPIRYARYQVDRLNRYVDPNRGIGEKHQIFGKMSYHNTRKKNLAIAAGNDIYDLAMVIPNEMGKYYSGFPKKQVSKGTKNITKIINNSIKLDPVITTPADSALYQSILDYNDRVNSNYYK